MTLLADNATARIHSGDLTVDKTTVIANNTDKATYTARVTDAGGNTLQNYKVAWSTDKGTLSAAESITDAEGKARIELRDTKVGTAIVTATVRNSSTKAEAVTFSADVNTARVVVVSEEKRITGTGVETTQLTATVTDANDNVLSDYPLVWNSTLGKITGNSGNTDAKGKATATLTAPELVATQNGKAIVTAGGSTGKSGHTTVTVRAVLKGNGIYYWTMYSEHHAETQLDASTFCKKYGGGHLAKASDLTEFKKANLDFDNMKVRGEYEPGWYRLAEDTPKKGIFNSSAYERNVIGKVDDGGEWSQQDYVCVK